MRYLTAGESHGEALIGIIEGLPAGLKVDVEFINRQLQRRQSAPYRGERSRQGGDRAHILSGLSGGITTGAPLCIAIGNDSLTAPKFDFFRPGHADYVAYNKYGYSEAWLGAERASARETAVRTALGAVAIELLSALNISVSATAEVNEELVARAKEHGDTAGGKVILSVKGVIPGIGSHVHWDRRFGSRLGGALFGIPAVKAVEYGQGAGFSAATGRECADEFAADGKRLSNNCGGIEGGITNGEEIVATLTFKPVPSVSGLKTVDVHGNSCLTQSVRGDICIAPAACPIVESVAALELASAILDCLGGDTMLELTERYAKKGERHARNSH